MAKLKSFSCRTSLLSCLMWLMSETLLKLLLALRRLPSILSSSSFRLPHDLARRTVSL